MSGVVKLTSGDESWWDLTALNYHYWTQPLPTVLGWWAHQAPAWLQEVLDGVCTCGRTRGAVPDLGAATAAPARRGAADLLAGRHRPDRQLRILQSPHDRALPAADRRSTWRLARRKMAGQDSVEPGAMATAVAGSTQSRATSAAIARFAAVAVLVVTLPLNAMLIFSAFKPRREWPRLLVTTQELRWSLSASSTATGCSAS